MKRISTILESYGISLTTLQTGVYRHKCYAFSMERRLRKWICRTCLHSSHDARISALQDYVFLVKPTITKANSGNS